jgi:hypothetical protein
MGCGEIFNNKNNIQKFEGNLSCEKCNGLYKSGTFCKLCMRTYDEGNTTEDFVGCDSCECWVHASCDGITKKKLTELENSKQGYF